MKYVLMLLFIPLSACVSVDTTNTNGSSASSSQSQSLESSLPAGDFTFENGEAQGTAYVRGYVTTQQVPEPFCDTNCHMYDYAFFRVLDAGTDPDLQGYLNEMQNNSHTEGKAIGLGCTDADDAISYFNHAGSRMTEHHLSPTDSVRILSATREKPITLRLTKVAIDGGMGSPACYAHFTTVEIVDAE